MYSLKCPHFLFSTAVVFTELCPHFPKRVQQNTEYGLGQQNDSNKWPNAHTANYITTNCRSSICNWTKQAHVRKALKYKITFVQGQWQYLALYIIWRRMSTYLPVDSATRLVLTTSNTNSQFHHDCSKCAVVTSNTNTQLHHHCSKCAVVSCALEHGNR